LGRAGLRRAFRWGLGLGLVGLAFGVLEAARVTAEENGVDSSFYFDGAVACGGSAELAEDPGCHADPESDLVQVTIAGPDFIEDAGGAAAYTATASCLPPLVCSAVTLGAQRGAGINVLIDSESSTSDCELQTFPTPTANQLIEEGLGPVLTHRDATTPPGPQGLGSLGVFSYQFLLADCQAPGVVRVLVAMNTFNFDGESLGDAWNKTEKTVTVPEPGSAGAALAIAALASLARSRRRPA
jgi:hypothetical protein